ncbi:MAG: hypothetical protein ACR2M3_00215 [Thermomicrobiales bacterium]
MRRNGIVLGIALLSAMLGVSVAAANPAITVSATRRDASGAVVALLPITDTQGNVVPPLALLGEDVIASGQGFPPNQPVQASLVAQNQAYPLAYQDLTTAATASQAAPMTDGTGAFQNLAFVLPASGQITDMSGEIFVSVGAATAHAPIAIDSGIATAAGRGDKIAVSIGAAFFAVAAILILLLVRGLPVYPIGQTTARRVRETETT